MEFISKNVVIGALAFGFALGTSIKSLDSTCESDSLEPIPIKRVQIHNQHNYELMVYSLAESGFVQDLVEYAKTLLANNSSLRDSLEHYAFEWAFHASNYSIYDASPSLLNGNSEYVDNDVLNQFTPKEKTVHIDLDVPESHLESMVKGSYQFRRFLNLRDYKTISSVTKSPSDDNSYIVTGY